MYKCSMYKVFFWFGLMLNIPVNNFSCWDGATASLVLPVLFGGVNMSCSWTQHGDPSGTRTPPLDPESEVLTTRPPRCPMYKVCFRYNVAYNFLFLLRIDKKYCLVNSNTRLFIAEIPTWAVDIVGAAQNGCRPRIENQSTAGVCTYGT